MEDSEIKNIQKEILVEQVPLIVESIREICNSFIRILGDKWRYEGGEYHVPPADSIETLPKKAKNYITKCAEIHNLNKEKLKQLIWKLVCEKGGHRKGILESKNLFIKIVNSHDDIWLCPSCRRPHLHKSGGICSNCFSRLNSELDDKKMPKFI